MIRDPLFLPFVNVARDPPVRPSREYVHIQNYLIGLVCVDLFSPGKIDATVEVKIDRRPKIKRHRPDTGHQVQTKVLPLELKTGKMFTKLGNTSNLTNLMPYLKI